MRPSGLSGRGLPCVWMLAAAVGLAGSAAHADAPRAAAGPSEGRRDPMQWLQAIQNAAQRDSYTGTIVYQHGDEVRSSRIVHYFEGNSVHERVQTLDGRPREFIRQGDEVQCLYPTLRRVVIEHAGSRPAFPALSQAGLGHVLERYALQQGENERVAGLDCTTLQLVPRDALRYGYRLWVDPVCGLLLKVQVVNADGAVIEQIAFADVRIGLPVGSAHLKPSWSTAGWEVVRHASREVPLSRRGWSLSAPEGFRTLTEVERTIGSDSPRQALQAVSSRTGWRRSRCSSSRAPRWPIRSRRSGAVP